jgi:Tol biopolymer transport system component
MTRTGIVLWILFATLPVYAQGQVEFGAVVFISLREGEPKLYVADQPGGEPQPLSNVTLPEDAYLLSVSASGTWFGAAGGSESVLVHIATGDVLNLLDYPNVGEIVWSPVGDRALFVAYPLRRAQQLYLVDMTSREPIALGPADGTMTPGMVTGWSMVAFTSDLNGIDIYTLM